MAPPGFAFWGWFFRREGESIEAWKARCGCSAWLLLNNAEVISVLTLPDGTTAARVRITGDDGSVREEETMVFDQDGKPQVAEGPSPAPPTPETGAADGAAERIARVREAINNGALRDPNSFASNFRASNGFTREDVRRNSEALQGRARTADKVTNIIERSHDPETNQSDYNLSLITSSLFNNGTVLEARFNLDAKLCPPPLGAPLRIAQLNGPYPTPVVNGNQVQVQGDSVKVNGRNAGTAATVNLEGELPPQQQQWNLSFTLVFYFCSPMAAFGTVTNNGSGAFSGALTVTVPSIINGVGPYLLAATIGPLNVPPGATVPYTTSPFSSPAPPPPLPAPPWFPANAAATITGPAGGTYGQITPGGCGPCVGW